MKGLIYKDFVMLRKQLTTYLVFLIVYGGFCIAGVFPTSILVALVAVVGLTVPLSSVATDDATHWDRYAVSTPVSRRGIVAGKYLFAVLVILLGAAVTAVLMLLFWSFGMADASLEELLSMVAACIFLTLLLNAVTLPFLLKYGAEKARMISMVLFVSIFGGSILVGGLISRGLELPRFPDWVLLSGPILLAVFCVAAYLVSYLISLNIYRKKEF